MPAPSFAEVLDGLHEIAPLELAADWDNVGLVLQPQQRPGRVRRALLTIDLTESVADEAVRQRIDLVIAYHPPIFTPLRRLSAAEPKQRALLRCAAAGIAVYSPHTALDAAPSGLADWLAAGVAGRTAPKAIRPIGDGEFGRVVELAAPLPVPALLARLRRHLGVRALQVALPSRGRQTVRSVAVAAGAGGSLLRGVEADVVVTGEMSHHDALAAVADGCVVVLAGHSNTERGYLPDLQRRLAALFDGDLDVRLARTDRDPFASA